MKPATPKPNSQPKSALLESMVAEVVKNDRALSIFAHVNDMPEEEPYQAIKQALASPSIWINSMGVILNGVVHSKKTHFFLSQTYLPKYWEADPNFTKRTMLSIQGTEYKGFLNDQLRKFNGGNAFLREVIAPSKKGAPNHRAGVYTLASQEFTSLLPWWNEVSSSFTGPVTGLFTNRVGEDRTEQVRIVENRLVQMPGTNCELTNGEVVTCIDDSLEPRLKRGKQYTVDEVLDHKALTLVGIDAIFHPSRFQALADGVNF